MYFVFNLANVIMGVAPVPTKQIFVHSVFAYCYQLSFMQSRLTNVHEAVKISDRTFMLR